MKILPFAYFFQTLLLPLGWCAGGSPKYQAVVFPELFHERSDDGRRVLKLNEDITLKLTPSSVLPEDFFLRTHRQGVAQYRYFDVEALQEDLYHDERALAAVSLSEEGGTLQVEGVVGPNLKIKPIEEAERAGDGRQPHLIETIEDIGNVYGKTFQNELLEVSSRDGFDPKAYNVEEIFPEVLVQCDSKFREGFKDENVMLKYLMREFIVVNLRYRTVTQPKVQIIFRGVQVTKAEEETYYYHYTDGQIDGYESLQKIVKHVKKKNASYEEYDMVFFMTGYDMIAVQASVRVESLSGYAFVGSACTDHREQLGEDTAHSYKGIRIMAHEMAHTLGCPHDGSSIDGIVKAFRPDSTQCPWDRGFLMSYIEKDFRSMQFSWCCTYQIAQMSWSIGASCLRRNDSTKSLPKRKNRIKLPGEILNKNKQCKLTYPELKITYFMEEFGIHYCEAQCFVPGEQFNAADSNWPMLLIDGSPCNKRGDRCINGECRPIRIKMDTPKEGTRPTTQRTTDYE